MARSTVAIMGEALPDVLALLAHIVTITGSEKSEGGAVVLGIEGDCVPDAPRVLCTISKNISRSGASFSVRFDRDNSVLGDKRTLERLTISGEMN